VNRNGGEAGGSNQGDYDLLHSELPLAKGEPYRNQKSPHGNNG
jgi:hypothetical protein